MAKNKTAPYSPSWLNYLTKRIEQLPGPSWKYYSGFGLILLVFETTVLWIEKAAPLGTFLRIHIFLAIAIPFIARIISYFDERAKSSLETIKPALIINDDKYQELEYQLINLPAFPSILASILALIYVFTTESIGGGAYQVPDLVGYPFSANLSRAIYLICWCFFGVFIYHTIHHLGLINQIYTHYTKVNLFHMKPLYGFSNLTALTAGSLIIPPYGFLIVSSEVQLSDPIVLGFYLIISFIAITTFLLPQLGIHNVQNQEKDLLLDKAKKRYEAIVAELHQNVDDHNYEGMANLNLALSNIEMELKTIKQTPTWPWQPETVRWLFTALILPLLMWAAQHFLGQLVNP
jgi:hypothetical protein